MSANEPNDPDAEQIDPDLARADALSLYKRIREAHRGRQTGSGGVIVIALGGKHEPEQEARKEPQMSTEDPKVDPEDQIDPDLARANALRLDHRLRETLDVEAQSREELNQAIGVWAQGKADEISEIAQMLDGAVYEEEARDLRQAEGLLRNVASRYLKRNPR
jgi:hypothetical protein